MWDNAKDKYLGITADEVRKLFDYNPEDGHLRWKVSRQKIIKGGIAGYINNKGDGYRYICFNKKDFMAHRLVWLWVTGEWPECQIDHINRIKNDNRFDNLRQATNSLNMRNIGTKAQSNNKSTKYRGIDIYRGKYRVRITTHGKTIKVGKFTSLQEAKAARLEAEQKYWHNE